MQVVFGSIVKEGRQLRREGLQLLAVGKVEGKQLCIEGIVYWKRHSEKRQGVCRQWQYHLFSNNISETTNGLVCVDFDGEAFGSIILDVIV